MNYKLLGTLTVLLLLVMSLSGCVSNDHDNLSIEDKDDQYSQDYKNIYYLLKNKFGDDCSVIMMDATYSNVSKSTIIDFLAKDNTDEYKYIEDEYDCDEYARRLWGNFATNGYSDYPVGLLYVHDSKEDTSHILNCFVDQDNNVWIIEPQTDQIYSATKYESMGNIYKFVLI